MAQPLSLMPMGPASRGAPVKAGRENWRHDESVRRCGACSADFNFARWKHHCRACGDIFCWKCSSKTIEYTPRTRRGEEGYTPKQKRVCERCFARILDAGEGAGATKVDRLVLRDDIRAHVKVSLEQIAKLQARLHERRGEAVELDEAIQIHRGRKWRSPAAGDRAAELCEWSQIWPLHEGQPEDLRQFTYHDRTADILVHCRGSTKADAFAQVSLGLLQYMTELLRRAAGGATCEELGEFLFIYSYEMHAVCRDVEVVEVDEGVLGAGKRGFGEAWAARADEASAGTRARTRHTVRRAGRPRREEERKLSHGATSELAGEPARRQDTAVHESQGSPQEGGREEHRRGDASPATPHDHTSDIVLQCWGKTRASAFAQLCVGTFHYLTKFDAAQAHPLPDMGDTAGHDLVDRLHRVLYEFLFVFRIEVLRISPNETLVDDDAAAARIRAREAARGGEDDVRTRLLRGASSELSYALTKTLVDDAAAARIRAWEVARGGKDDVRTRLLRGASSELSYALTKRLHAFERRAEEAAVAAAAGSPAAKEEKEGRDVVQHQPQPQQPQQLPQEADAALAPAPPPAAAAVPQGAAVVGNAGTPEKPSRPGLEEKQQMQPRQEEDRTPEKLGRPDAAAAHARRDAAADQKRKKRQPQ